MKIPKLFTTCFLVSGNQQSIICDIQRSKIYYIPNALQHILTHYVDKSIDTIKAAFEKENEKFIDEYFDYLLEHELIFYTKEPEKFPPVEIKWESYNIINNCIIDVNKDSEHDYVSIFSELEELRCDFIEIRFYDTVPTKELKKIIEYTAHSRFRNMTYFIKYHPDLEQKELEYLLLVFQRIGTIVVHSSPKEITDNYNNFNKKLIYKTDVLDSEKHCGQISEQSFQIDMSLFMESNFYNNCLNKKIGISVNGDIKNCPSMPKSYGNISQKTLQEAINTSGFKNSWGINKSKIHVCKDCEFRYICTDCRAYIEDPDDIYSKPLKCGYNPLTAEWDEWSKNPLKQKVIKAYGLSETVKEK